jgi:hypothetical protein
MVQYILYLRYVARRLQEYRNIIRICKHGRMDATTSDTDTRQSGRQSTYEEVYT